MSQNPLPYASYPRQPPYAYPYGDDPVQAALAPARRASVMMFVLGGLSLLFALCLGVVPALMDFEQMMTEANVEPPPEAAELGVSASRLMQIAFIIYAVILGGMSLALLLLGAFVRKGGKGATITSLVLMSLGILLLLLLGAAGFQGRPENALGFLCIAGIPLGLMIAMWVMLYAALKAAPQVQAALEQQQYQYWQYHQQQQAYAQGGYYQQPSQGPYVQQLPPPPPPPEVPPEVPPGGSDEQNS